MTTFEVLVLTGLVVLIGLGAAAVVLLLRSPTLQLDAKLDGIDRRLSDSIGIVNLAVQGMSQENSTSGKALRDEVSQRFSELSSGMGNTLKTIGSQLSERLDGFGKQLGESRNAAAEDAKALRTEVNNSLMALGKMVEGRLDKMREENAAKLEEMRVTVDEKLQGTLEKRLGASFNQVNESLKRVFESVGEMQALATGVGDLKRVLSNVKLRGSWGEGSLGAILDDLLTPEQFSRNVEVNPGSGQRVEFALRQPGTGENAVWVPIDSKMPKEDYERLTLASEQGDAVAVELCGKALERCVLKHAADISTKYICHPHTTEFALLFLPTEGLFAEVVRRPGLVDKIRAQHRIEVCGPTTLTAYLHVLRSAFKAMAIQERSSEVWQVLGAVKTEFGRFGDVLEKVHKKLGEAQNVVEDAHRRRRAMDRKLRDVEALPETTAQDVLALTAVTADELLDDDEETAEAAE
jgi:DNA recombination protein RmuC